MLGYNHEWRLISPVTTVDELFAPSKGMRLPRADELDNQTPCQSMEAAFHENNYYFHFSFPAQAAMSQHFGWYEVHLVGVYIHCCNMAVFCTTVHILAVACIRQVTTNGMHRVLYRIKVSPPIMNTVSILSPICSGVDSSGGMTCFET